jgi:hypothetical protein
MWNSWSMKSRQGRLLQAIVVSVWLGRALYFLYFAQPHDWQRSEFNFIVAICFALVSSTNTTIWKKYSPRDTEMPMKAV